MALGGVASTVPLVSITTIQSGFQEPPVAGILGVAFDELSELEGSMTDDDLTTSLPSALGTFLKGAGLCAGFISKLHGGSIPG